MIVERTMVAEIFLAAEVWPAPSGSLWTPTSVCPQAKAVVKAAGAGGIRPTRPINNLTADGDLHGLSRVAEITGKEFTTRTWRADWAASWLFGRFGRARKGAIRLWVDKTNAKTSTVWPLAGSSELDFDAHEGRVPYVLRGGRRELRGRGGAAAGCRCTRPRASGPRAQNCSAMCRVVRRRRQPGDHAVGATYAAIVIRVGLVCDRARAGNRGRSTRRTLSHACPSGRATRREATVGVGRRGAVGPVSHRTSSPDGGFSPRWSRGCA
jgi:hypothetical protein